MSGRSPPLYCTLILVTMRSHQSYHNITTVVIHSYEYSTTLPIIVPSRHTGIGAWVNSKLYTSILYNLILMQGYCTNTEYTGSLGCNPVMGGKQMSKRLGRIKGCKIFKEKSERYITCSGNGWVSLKGISGGIYVDVILVHIKIRLDLLGIQTFSRWDQRLGRQYSNLNRHVSTQEKQNQRQYSTSSSMVL